MPDTHIEKLDAAKHKSSFFRQSGWMMITAVGGGSLMFLVTTVAFKLFREEEYNAFVALIQLTNWMMIPALGLQMVFTEQAAAAVTDKQQRQLVSTTKSVLLWTFCIWLIMALVTVSGLRHWTELLRLNSSTPLLVTLFVGFAMLWQPIFQGLLQGRQDFLWLGWVAVINGVGRLVIGGLIVLVLHTQAAGLLTGVLIGLIAAVGLAAWQNIDLLRQPSEPFDKIGWLRRVIPLTLGFGASTFLFSADAIVVQNYLGAEGKGAYMFGSTLCRAIVLFTAPVAAVMFPKLVQNRVSAKKTNVMGMTMLLTGALCFIAVAGLWVASPFIFQKLGKDPTNAILPLIPLFALGMVPLGMGNVLLYSLMAHSRFKIVPALVIMAVTYWLALQRFHETFKIVIETFDIFALIFLGICALFTWVIGKAKM